MPRVPRPLWLVSTLLLAIQLPTPAVAEKRSASIRLDYQYIRTGEFDSSIGDIDIGHTDAHVALLSASYSPNSKMTFSASLPYIKKRHEGAFAHAPAVDLTQFPEADQSVVDNGDFHSDWQDLYVTATWHARRGRWSISPFVSVGVPTNDYPFYGHAAVGRNIWHVPVGVAVGLRPYFSDWFIDFDAAYVFTEKSLGVDISHWLVNLDLAYHVTPSVVARVFANLKYSSGGLDFPDDFDVLALNDEAWYFHDRTIRHNFLNAGLGVDWAASERYTVSVSALTMVDPDQVNKVDKAFSVGITRYFDFSE